MSRLVRFLRVTGTTFLILTLPLGCGLSTAINMQKLYKERSTLPDDYAQVIDNPKIDRPVVIVVPLIKMTAQMLVNTEKMATTERNFLINRLLTNKTFRQILPQDDPTDPSLPSNSLILRYESHRIVVSAAPYRKVPLMPSTNEIKMELRDLRDGSSLITEGLMKISPHESGLADLSFSLDSGESERVELAMSEPDFSEKQVAWTESCIDKLINSLVGKSLDKKI